MSVVSWGGIRYLIVKDQNYKNPYFDATLTNHTESGFKNVPDHLRPSVAALWRWTLTNFIKRKSYHSATSSLNIIDKLPQYYQQLSNPTRLQAAWLGHSTVLLQQDGVNYLTDPIFSNRASAVSYVGPKRLQPVPLTVAELPRIDAVLISHDHFDHLDLNSVKQLYALPSKPHFYVPLGIELWFKQHVTQGDLSRVHALDWWQNYTHIAANGQPHTVSLVPALHWSKRHLVGSNKTLWGGFIVQSPNDTSYFAGDTAYSPTYFKQIGEKFGPIDLALIPVGAYEPRWFMRFSHVNEFEAVKIFKDVKALQAIGIHWGTFQLTSEAPDAPKTVLPQALREAGIPERHFQLLQHGQLMDFAQSHNLSKPIHNESKPIINTITQ